MLKQLPDIFDPRNWELEPQHECRIYGNDNAQSWGIVSEIDYHFLIQWKWSWTTPKPGHRKNAKIYLRRNFEVQIDPDKFQAGGLWTNPETGNLVRFRKPRVQQSVRMHTVIMLRTDIVPPTPEYNLVDHIDGNERNYTRENLRWADYSLNNSNRFGKDARDGNCSSSS